MNVNVSFILLYNTYFIMLHIILYRYVTFRSIEIFNGRIKNSFEPSHNIQIQAKICKTNLISHKIEKKIETFHIFHFLQATFTMSLNE